VNKFVDSPLRGGFTLCFVTFFKGVEQYA